MEKKIKWRAAKFVLFIKYYVDHKKDDEIVEYIARRRATGVQNMCSK
jgi:hypothetical protein